MIDIFIWIFRDRWLIPVLCACARVRVCLTRASMMSMTDGNLGKNDRKCFFLCGMDLLSVKRPAGKKLLKDKKHAFDSID